VLVRALVAPSIDGVRQFDRALVGCGLVSAVTVRGICAAGIHAEVAAVVGEA
jgi:hypothetical protein